MIIDVLTEHKDYGMLNGIGFRIFNGEEPERYVGSLAANDERPALVALLRDLASRIETGKVGYIATPAAEKIIHAAWTSGEDS